MAAPTNLTATAIDDDSISLSWDAYTGASGYDIERDSVVIVSNHPTNSYTDTGLDPATSYDYRVRAKLGATTFNPETDITWHSLFWTEGSAFTASGLADTDAVTTWLNETAEGDAVLGSVGGVYDASRPSFNGRPVVEFVGGGDTLVATVSDLPQPFTLVMIGETSTADSNSVSMFGGSLIQFQSAGDGTGAMRFRGASNGSSRSGGMNGTPQRDTPHLHIGVADGATTRQWVDRGASVTYDNGSTGATMGTTLTIKGQGTTKYAFCAAYAGDLELDPNYAAFVAWASTHYGLPAIVGGTQSNPGDGYVYHTFTTSGTLTPIGDPVEVEYLVVAGGGGGGNGTSSSTPGGGGGAGGLLAGAATVASAQTVTIGGGGPINTSGTATALGPISPVGGGRGAYLSTAAATGGSGGGGDYDGTGAIGTTGQGYAGGDGNGTDGAGGGGAGEAGEGAGVTGAGGDGGDGLQWPTASGTYYAGGGGGAVVANGEGSGGLGGGGKGQGSTNAQAGTANTGGGGGGTKGATTGIGGSGITIVRYPVDYAGYTGGPLLTGITTTGSAGASTSTFNVTPPTGLLVGQSFFVALTQDGAVDVLDTQTGFTLVSSYKTAEPYCYVFTRQHDGSSTYTFTRGGTYTPVIYWASVGFAAGAIGAVNQGSGWGLTPTLPSVSPTAQSRLVSVVSSNSIISTHATFTGWTDVAEQSQHLVSEKTDLVAAGATGTFVAATNFSGNITWVAQTIAIEAV